MADEPGITRFHRERAIVNGGYWAHLKKHPNARGVLLVLLINSNFDSGIVRMSMEDIAHDAGIDNLQRARMAYKLLEELGICETVNVGGGYGERAVRRVLCPASMKTTGPVSGPVDLNYRAAQRPGTTGPLADNYRAAQRSTTGPLSGPPLHIAHKSQSSSHPKTGPLTGPVDLSRVNGGKEEEIFNFLVGKKVWEHSAKRLTPLLAVRGGVEDARRIFNQLVNDKAVKESKRDGAYYYRLCDYLGIEPNGRTRHPGKR